MKKRFILLAISLLFLHDVYGMQKKDSVDDSPNYYYSMVHNQSKSEAISDTLAKFNRLKLRRNVSIKHPKYRKIFFKASAFNELSQLILELLKKGIDPNPNEGLMSALGVACQTNSIINVTNLLAYNADPNLCDNVIRITPLMTAVDNGYVKIINMLLEKGANPNLLNRDGKTALIIACERYNFIRAAQELLNISNFSNINFFSGAFASKIDEIQESVILALLKNGAKPDIKYQGKNAIEWANEKGLNKIAELMSNYLTSTKDKSYKECSYCKSINSSNKKLMKCSRCLTAFYCDQDCQKKDWRIHKLYCKKPTSKTN